MGALAGLGFAYGAYKSGKFARNKVNSEVGSNGALNDISAADFRSGRFETAIGGRATTGRQLLGVLKHLPFVIEFDGRAKVFRLPFRLGTQQREEQSQNI